MEFSVSTDKQPIKIIFVLSKDLSKNETYFFVYASPGCIPVVITCSLNMFCAFSNFNLNLLSKMFLLQVSFGKPIFSDGI